MIYIEHGSEHACISCNQIVVGISSDAGWLEEDLSALRGLNLRLLFLELVLSAQV